jgi:hypothetical protein
MCLSKKSLISGPPNYHQLTHFIELLVLPIKTPHHGNPRSYRLAPTARQWNPCERLSITYGAKIIGLCPKGWVPHEKIPIDTVSAICDSHYVMLWAEPAREGKSGA